VLARPISAGDPNVFDGAIDKIEFLGSYCLVRVNAESIGNEPLTVYLSLNYLAEQGCPSAAVCRSRCCPSGCASSSAPSPRVGRPAPARRARRSPALALDRPRRHAALLASSPRWSSSSRCRWRRSSPRRCRTATATSSASPTSPATCARRRCCSPSSTACRSRCWSLPSPCRWRSASPTR
jgi:hypothetical protein